MCSTDSTNSSTSSGISFNRKRSRIFSLFKFNGSKMEDHLHRKLSEPNPAEMLLYRKHGPPAIKLWTPENTEMLRVRDDLCVEKIKKKSNKFKKDKIRKGTLTSEEDDYDESRRSSNTSTPLKRSHSFRESWNRLWNKNPPKYRNGSTSSSSGSEKSMRGRKNNQKPEEISTINVNSDATTHTDNENNEKNKNEMNEVKMNKDNNENFLSVIFANHHHNDNNNNVRNFKRDKLSRSVNDLSTVVAANAAAKPDTGDNVNLDFCQNNMAIKGHARRRSWTNFFTSG